MSGLFKHRAGRHWGVRALALGTIVAGAGFVIGKCAHLISGGKTAQSRPEGLLTVNQSKTCLSWALRMAGSADDVLEREALRFLAVAAIFDHHPEIEKGVSRLHASAQRQLEEGRPDLARRLEGYLRIEDDERNEDPKNKPEVGTPKRGSREWLIRGARGAATGSLDTLVSSYGTYIMVVQDYEPNDPVLWEGIRRLGDYALEHPSEKSTLR